MYLLELGKYQSLIDVNNVLYVDTFERVDEKDKNKIEYVLYVMFYTGGVVEYSYNSYERLMDEFNGLTNAVKEEERKKQDGIF